MIKKCGYCSRLWPDVATSCTCGTVDPFGDHLVRSAILGSIDPTVPGCDIASWDESPEIPGDIDFERMATRAKFVIVKRSQGRVADPDGTRNYQRAKGYLRRGGYAYQDWQGGTATDQADYLWSLLANDIGEVPPWWDFEQWIKAPEPGTARLFLKTALERLTYHLNNAGWDTLNRPVVIYTSPGYWGTFGSGDPYWQRYDLAIAHYGVPQPQIPRPWYTYRYWQDSDRGDGLAYGVEAKQIDTDRFYGDLVALDRYALPLPGGVTEESGVKYIVLTQDLRIRAFPNALSTTPILGKLAAGTILTTTPPHAYAPVVGGEAWIHFDLPIEGWAAVTVGYTQHMRTA